MSKKVGMRCGCNVVSQRKAKVYHKKADTLKGIVSVADQLSFISPIQNQICRRFLCQILLGVKFTRHFPAAMITRDAERNKSVNIE